MGINIQHNTFDLKSSYSLTDTQKQSVDSLVEGIEDGERFQCLHGITGSGKTFIMANVIERLNQPSLILSHNKTLAAQLYREFKDFFPNNAVEYFVSYYDYYQPEAYIPSRDLYIEKDSSINDEIERLRLSATTNLLTRSDVIVVASVSCIYGIGSPTSFAYYQLFLKRGTKLDINKCKKNLIDLQYTRNDISLERGTFRVRGETIDVCSAYELFVYRIELDWDEIKQISIRHPVSLELIREVDSLTIFPARNYIVERSVLDRAIPELLAELEIREASLLEEGRMVEAQRLKARVQFDIDMLQETGTCSGIENYSRILGGRDEGERPSVLLDYFPKSSLCFIDESHVTLPQVRAMYNGDRARKTMLVEHGFRLPSALDNRPLRSTEFEALINRCVLVSATPGSEESRLASKVTEQIIRPTGLLDPKISVRKTEGQMENLYEEIQNRVEKRERVLITTLTKKLAENLTDYLSGLGVRARYLHSDTETIERVELLTDLRNGVFDVLVGINLLREGLDLPEVSLVAILDADKVGFLRSATSLIQTIGRAARNEHGTVIMYADKISDAMQKAIEETDRRRAIQEEYNHAHNIQPASIQKAIYEIIARERTMREKQAAYSVELLKQEYNIFNRTERKKYIQLLEEQMREAAERLAFEEAVTLRDEIASLKKMGDR